MDVRTKGLPRGFSRVWFVLAIVFVSACGSGNVPGPNVAPTVSGFTATPVDGTRNVTFAWQVTDPNGDSLTCDLDLFGDGAEIVTFNNCGNTSTQVETYPDVGRFSPTLTVTDSSGESATANTTVSVGREVFDLRDPRNDVTITDNAVNVFAFPIQGESFDGDIIANIDGQDYPMPLKSRANCLSCVGSSSGYTGYQVAIQPIGRRGTFPLEVRAVDASGVVFRDTRTIVYNEQPVLGEFPLVSLSVARPTLPFVLDCSDDDPDNPPIIRVMDGDTVILEETAPVDTVLTLSDGFVDVTCTDSDGQRDRFVRDFVINDSPRFTDLATVPGTIETTDGDRIIYRTDEGIWLFTLATNTTEEITIPNEFSFREAFLVPNGYLLQLRPFAGGLSVFSFQNGTLQEIGVGTLRVSGDFGLYGPTFDAFTLHNFATGVTTPVGLPLNTTEVSLSSSGAIAGNLSNCDVYVWRNGVFTQLVIRPDRCGSAVRTDGNTAAYESRASTSIQAPGSVAIHDLVSETILDDTWETRDVRSGIDVRDGWVAFPGLIDDVWHLFMRDPGGVTTEIALFDQPSVLITLGDNGQAVFRLGNLQLTRQTDYVGSVATGVVDLGISFGTTLWANGTFYRYSGSSLLEINTN
ncbi:MAG: hypothetical protein AAF438_15625 [Pseudomonadota bacterium]